LAVTTRRSNKPKSFSWSYSKLKNFEVCPHRHQQVDLLRAYKEEDSDQLKWGNAVHKALADHIGKGTPLPEGMQGFKKYVERVIGDGTGEICVEQKYALTKEFKATGFFDSDAWFRGIGDVVRITGNGKVTLIVDWKTGKIVEDSQQLAFMAACVFAKYPNVQVVRSTFVWIKEDADTTEDFTRKSISEMWAAVWPRITALENAHSTNTYPATPNRLCRLWCPVEKCAHHGT